MNCQWCKAQKENPKSTLCSICLVKLNKRQKRTIRRLTEELERLTDQLIILSCAYEEQAKILGGSSVTTPNQLEQWIKVYPSIIEEHKAAGVLTHFLQADYLNLKDQYEFERPARYWSTNGMQYAGEPLNEEESNYRATRGSGRHGTINNATV